MGIEVDLFSFQPFLLTPEISLFLKLIFEILILINSDTLNPVNIKVKTRTISLYEK